MPIRPLSPAQLQLAGGKADAEDEGAHAPLSTGSTLQRFALAIIISYLVGGSSFYSYAEGWEWADALYFCVVTLLTVVRGPHL